MVLWRRDFLDVHIDAQMSAEPGSSFHGKEGQQHEEINLIGTLTSHPVHCKEKMPKIGSTYSQERSIGVSVPISTFMCL
jgi:hypothetical protein